jgi:hypothetical protein
MADRIADGATLGDLQALILKATQQMRTMGPPSHVMEQLDNIEAQVAEMKERGKAARV